MNTLKEVFLTNGFKQVKTYIASGNVIFDSSDSDVAALEYSIETFLKDALGYRVDTFIRTPEQIQQIVQSCCFPDISISSEHALYVAFLKHHPVTDIQKAIMDYQSEVDNFHFQNNEMYWLRNKTLPPSKFTAARFEKRMNSPVTLRNMTMLRKLTVLLNADA